jgi:hypothetical protein
VEVDSASFVVLFVTVSFIFRSQNFKQAKEEKIVQFAEVKKSTGVDQERKLVVFLSFLWGSYPSRRVVTLFFVPVL